MKPERAGSRGFGPALKPVSAGTGGKLRSGEAADHLIRDLKVCVARCFAPKGEYEGVAIRPLWN